MFREITTQKHIPQRMMRGEIVEGKKPQTVMMCFFSPIYKPQTQEEKAIRGSKENVTEEQRSSALPTSSWRLSQSTPQTRCTLSPQLNRFSIFQSNHFFHKAYAQWGCLSTYSI